MVSWGRRDFVRLESNTCAHYCNTSIAGLLASCAWSDKQGKMRRQGQCQDIKKNLGVAKKEITKREGERRSEEEEGKRRGVEDMWRRRVEEDERIRMR